MRISDWSSDVCSSDLRLKDFGLERQHPFDPLRRDIVALVVNDQVLLAVGDDDAALRVDMADVAGMEPRPLVGLRRVGDEDALRLGLVAPIAVHDELSSEERRGGTGGVSTV